MESSPDGVPGVTGRFGFDTNISLHDMGDSYLAQYKIAIPEGKALGMMCSYTSINGTAVCESTRWQQDWARKKMGFTGNIVSSVTHCGEPKVFPRLPVLGVSTVTKTPSNPRSAACSRTFCTYLHSRSRLRKMGAWGEQEKWGGHGLPIVLPSASIAV